MMVWPALLVHILTASGAAAGLFALIAATRGDWTTMFVWLGAALLIDACDGPLARQTNVAAVLPRWSGDTLDLVVDYTTYVFVPAYAIVGSGLMPTWLAMTAAAAITVSSALYFADGHMKTGDNFFRGFPALWNLVAFYLLLFRPSSALTALCVAVLVILTFVPVKFVHPVRVQRWRPVTLALLVAWSGLAVIAVAYGLSPPTWVSWTLALLVIYFLSVGLWPDRKQA